MQINDAVKQEQKEVLVVVEAHAVVYPWAVVIHLQDTRPAHSAMVATVWLVLTTPLAMPSIA